MKIKYKLLSVLLLTLVILMGGCFLLLNQYGVVGSKPLINDAIHKLIEEQNTKTQIVPFNEGRGNLYKKSNRPTNELDYSLDKDNLVEFEDKLLSDNYSINPNRFGTGKHLQERASSSQLGGTYSNQTIHIVAFGQDRLHGVAKGGASYGGIGSANEVYNNGIMGVPTFGLFGDDDDRVLVDPGPTSNNSNNQVIPVGNGLSFLFLLALAYAYVRIRGK